MPPLFIYGKIMKIEDKELFKLTGKLDQYNRILYVVAEKLATGDVFYQCDNNGISVHLCDAKLFKIKKAAQTLADKIINHPNHILVLEDSSEWVKVLPVLVSFNLDAGSIIAGDE